MCSEVVGVLGCVESSWLPFISLLYCIEKASWCDQDQLHFSQVLNRTKEHKN